MTNENILVTISIVALIACFAGAYLYRKKSKSAQVESAPLAVYRDSSQERVLGSIAIGEKRESPAVTITNVLDFSEFDRAQPISDSESGSINRLNALLQAAPGALVAGEASRKRILEVVVNGDLVRAADGNGMRAFVTGGKGIKENARLFEVQNLQNIINAAAIWQIASVVVAQKHLADISKKLDEIKSGISGISRFLDSQRRSRITSTSEYLGQVYFAIQSGELPAASKIQLEDCERDLLGIQDHLVAEYKDVLSERAKDSDTFGSEDITNNIGKKIQNINAISEDIALCVKARILCWYVLSLYPGDLSLKSARRDSILRSINSYEGLGKEFHEKMLAEIEAVKAFWTTEKTLRTRKLVLKDQSNGCLVNLGKRSSEGRSGVENSAQLLLESGKPIRLLFQYENEKLVGVRRQVR